jgi:hypothetical protein
MGLRDVNYVPQHPPQNLLSGAINKSKVKGENNYDCTILSPDKQVEKILKASMTSAMKKLRLQRSPTMTDPSKETPA